MLALFTNVGSESPWAMHHLADRRSLLPRRAARACSHLHQGHGRRAGERDGYERVRNAPVADACGVASTGGMRYVLV